MAAQSHVAEVLCCLQQREKLCWEEAQTQFPHLIEL